MFVVLGMLMIDMSIIFIGASAAVFFLAIVFLFF
jgi:hypothetical protein